MTTPRDYTDSRPSTTTPTRAEYARRIRERLGDAVEAVLDVGMLLIGAKAELPHGSFEAMVREDLGMAPQTARKWMAIARHPVLGDRARVRDLPGAWGTLGELAKIEAPRLGALIQDGVVTPTLTRAEASDLLRHHDDDARDLGDDLTEDEMAWCFALGDGVSGERFERAIATCKAEYDISAENLIRALRGEDYLAALARAHPRQPEIARVVTDEEFYAALAYLESLPVPRRGPRA